jgi:autotransporter translocation and assembly factor TamB
MPYILFMKRYFFIIAALFLMLSAGLALYVRSDAFSARIRPVVVAYLQDTLGPGIVVGRVRAGLIPLYLEVRDISIPDDHEAYAATVRKVRVYINPLPLIIRRVSLPAVTVLEPRLSLVRGEEGSLNFTRLMDRLQRSLQPSRGKASPAFMVRLYALDVKNGTISLIDRMTSSSTTVTGFTMSLHGDATGGAFKLSVRSADIKIAAAALPALDLNLKTTCDYRQGRLTIDTFILAAHDAWITVTGTVGKLPEGDLNLKIKSRIAATTIGKMTGIPGFVPPGKTQPRLDASASVQGTVSKPILTGSLTARGLDFRGIAVKGAGLTFGYRERTLTVEGKGWELAGEKRSVLIERIGAILQYREAGLEILQAVVTGNDLEARATGRVGFQSGYDAALTIESTGKSRTLNALLPALAVEGGIGVAGRVTGHLKDPRFDGSLSAGLLTVRGVLFSSAEGNVAYQGKKITLTETEIRQRSSRYVLEGSVDFAGKEPLYDARLDVIRSDAGNIVALFYRPLPLQISAKGEIVFTGTAKQYSGSAFLSLDAGKAYGESFDSGTVKVSLNTGRISFPQVVVYKGSGVVKGTGWIGFDGTYSAAVQSRFVDLSEVDLVRPMPVSGPFKFDIESSGSFKTPSVHATLEVPDLSYNKVSVGETASRLEIRERVLMISGNIGRDHARLTGKLELRAPYAWSASLSVHADRIDPFVVLGKKDFTARVLLAVDGTVTASGPGLDLSRISAVATFPRLGLSIGDYRIENEQSAGLIIDEGTLRITSLKFTGPATKLAVSGEAKLKKDVALALSGSANISLLRLLFQEVEYSDGLAELMLAVRDNWSSPDVTGDLRIRNGAIKIRDIPQTFTALNGRIAFSEGRVVVDSLTGEMGGGTLEISGGIQLAGLTVRDFSFKALGTDISVRYPAGLTSTLSGELYYEGNAAEQTLSGEVGVKQARYEKQVEWKTMLVEMARGLYQKKKTDVGWIGDTHLNIRFHGQEGFLLQNNLARMPLDVDVLLRGTINMLQLVGRMEARRGVVYFRNNDFKILHASADFIDPARLNPVLDIQAETRVRDYLIRLSVTGTAERALVTFISEPPLSDSDILGVLTLGKTGTELKGKEAGVGMGEAVSFATGQFQDIFEQRARSLTGLDRFQVDPYVSTGDTSVPRVTVGKEIVRDKLYVTYSSNVGASTPEPIIKVEYVLNRNLSVVGEQNELGKIGADVKFRFEFR